MKALRIRYLSAAALMLLVAAGIVWVLGYLTSLEVVRYLLNPT
jgi:hypothetical protein